MTIKTATIAETRPWPTPPPTFTVDPSRSVLLLIDFQRMQVERGCGLAGQIEAEFPDIADYFFPRMSTVVLPNVHKMLGVARERGMPIYFLTIGPERTDGKDLGPWKRARNETMKATGGGKGVSLKKGTSGHGLLDELEPREGEVVLNKSTFSGLLSTSLDLQLRNAGIDTIFVAGQATNVCVQGTASDAADLGYQVVLVEDACCAWDPDLHDAAIRNHGLMYGAVALADQAIELMTQGGRASGRGLPPKAAVH